MNCSFFFLSFISLHRLFQKRISIYLSTGPSVLPARFAHLEPTGIIFIIIITIIIINSQFRIRLIFEKELRYPTVKIKKTQERAVFETRHLIVTHKSNWRPAYLFEFLICTLSVVSSFALHLFFEISLLFFLSPFPPYFSSFPGLLPRYCGINVGWKKIQHHIGHFLVLVEYISIALSHKRKKFINQFFSN